MKRIASHRALYEGSNYKRRNRCIPTKIVNYLKDWALSEGPSLFALTGEFGTGKTVTCKLFAQALSEERERFPEQGIPLPVYFDLRDISRMREKYDSRLEDLLVEMLSEPGECIPCGTDIFQYVQRNPTVVIYDSFDQASISLTTEQQMRFYKNIMGIVRSFQEGSTKVLLSTRGEFFRSDGEMHRFLEMDGAIPDDKIQVAKMLLFTEKQILEYLWKNMGGEERSREDGRALTRECLAHIGLLQL